jgi:hypothetical protein
MGNLIHKSDPWINSIQFEIENSSDRIFRKKEQLELQASHILFFYFGPFLKKSRNELIRNLFLNSITFESRQ